MQIDRQIIATINIRRVALVVFSSILLVVLNLVLLDIVVNWMRITELRVIRQLFNMELEGSLANWVSSLIYLAVALGFWILAGYSRRFKGLFSLTTLGWLFFATVFTFLAADDGAEIHERIGTAVKAYAKDTAWRTDFSAIRWIADVFPSYYWQAVYTPIIAFVGLLMFCHFYREFKSWKLMLLLSAGFACFVIAQGLDYLEGIHFEMHTVIPGIELPKKATRHFQKVIEESLEMIGMGIVLLASLLHLGRLLPVVQISAAKPSSQDSLENK